MNVSKRSGADITHLYTVATLSVLFDFIEEIHI